MIKKLNEMLEMQKALDAAIYKEKGIDEVPFGNIRLALLDELGELNHELKPNWCWWKNNVGEVNRNHVLEELVDCYHFGLMLTYYENKDFKFTRGWLRQNEHTNRTIFEKDFFDYIRDIIFFHETNVIYYLNKLAQYLGFTISDVYNEYLRKNKVNYERLKNRY